MNVLLIAATDYDRRTLARFLENRGHRVTVAADVDRGLAVLRERPFEALVTQWQLGDDDASALIASAHGPCVVIATQGDRVEKHPAIAAVLTQPVSPSRLADQLSELSSPRPPGCVASVGELPKDTCDRVRAVLAILDDPNAARVEDDGSCITVEGRITDPERWVALLDGIGGDLRVTAGDSEDAPLRLLLRLDRRGLPSDVEVAVAADAQWPEESDFALDFHGIETAPDRFLALCDRVRQAGRSGRRIDLVNVPSHLRMCLETMGRIDDLPMRRASGPRLPEVIGELWR